LEGITSFSVFPLRLASLLGVLICFLSFIQILNLFYKKFVLEIFISGWYTIVVGIFFLGGVQLFVIGVIGEYIGKIYEESKHRPLYVIEEEINFD